MDEKKDAENLVTPKTNNAVPIMIDILRNIAHLAVNGAPVKELKEASATLTYLEEKYPQAKNIIANLSP